MGDSIDIDEIEIDDPDDDTDSNYGDWLWRGEGEPEDEPDSQWASSSAASVDDETAIESDDERTDSDSTGTETESIDEEESDESIEKRDRQPTPGVPRTSKGPVGVPEDKGGAGGGSSGTSDAADSSPTANAQRTTNHGGEPTPDEMTMAITYEAINRLADPRHVIADARGWADWVGMVGTVSTPAIRKFQRDNTIELDFFGGSETGPAQRLADITTESMFYADRMVLVGVEDNESIADAADWEFIPLETAAEKAGWEIEHAE